MFEYPEPDATDRPETGALPLPPNSGANDRGARPLTPEKVRYMLYGSLAALDRTIKILYADPNDGRAPIPVPPASEPGHPSTPQTWMAILTKTILIE